MLKTIYTETELRNKLSKYANERIESVKCDGVQIQIIFKEGYATSFLSSSSCDTEIYFTSIASMKEACKKFYLVEGQENLEKAKAKEQEEQEQQKEESEKEEKKEDNNMNKDLYFIKKEFEDGKKQVFTKCGYVFKSIGVRHDLVKDLSELDEIVTVEEYNKIFWSDYKADFSNVDPKESLKALEKAQPKEDKQEDKKKAPLSPSLGVGERELPTLEDSKEITSLRIDLTDSERNAISYLFELEKDRRNGIEWTAKEKDQAQKALDTLTYLGILDTFPNLKDFEPDLEDLDEFKFYKSESFYEGGYLPTDQAIDFLELSYDEIVEHDKVMALLQIPLNVLNVTEFIEVLPHDILRVHLKQGFQYQESSFIDAKAGEYQAFSLEDENQIEQFQMFDLEDEIEHFEEYQEQELEQLEKDLFDLDNKLEHFEVHEQQSFLDYYFDHGASFEEARQMAVQSAELAIGHKKFDLLDKQIELKANIEIRKQNLSDFKVFYKQALNLNK